MSSSIVKTTLDVLFKTDCLGGASPPALREGQKENKKGKSNMVKKMNKIHMTIFAVAFVALMIACPMTLRSVSASYVNHTYGVSYAIKLTTVIITSIQVLWNASTLTLMALMT